MLRPTRSGALLARLRGEYGGGESPAPYIVSITPSDGPEEGGTTVTIVVSVAVDNVNEVRFGSSASGVGGEPATNLTSVNSTTITCDTPMSPTGFGNVYFVVEDLLVGNIVGEFTYNYPGPA